MNAPLAKFEFEVRSLLAALQFVDAVSGAPVACRVKVTGGIWPIFVKRNGQVLIMANDDEADPLLPPSSHVFECFPVDPAYMPRKATVRLPRKNDGTADTIFNPRKIALYPSTSYRSVGNLGGLLFTLKEPPEKLVRGALVTLRQNGNSDLESRAISNAAGEALLIVKGAAVVQYSAGTHTEDINATLEIRVDADPKKRISNTPEAIAAARLETFLIDPDEVLGNAAIVPMPSPVTFRAGRIRAWPPP